ncbi:MAG: hypothetical protein TEF_17170 [Rhizobiales bacterium NRL2]|jgi:hypothetical protein|nr:MAG: hypothetical protein TEF_17170 [Rhizobiales bacterium NRL2]
MSDANAQNEPTMEEILASIRRIISEDDEEEQPKPDAAEEEDSVEEMLNSEPDSDPEPEPEPEPEPVFAPEPEPEPAPAPEPEEEEVLELTDMVEDEDSDTDLTGGAADDRMEAPAPPLSPQTITDRLISDVTAAESAASLAALTHRVSSQRDISVPTHRSLEDITKELLRPMLKEWLDKNLPAIVQRIVEREIAKLAGEVDDSKR